MRLIGVDVGGTFTDIVFADTRTGRTLIHKVPTTRDDPSRGVVDAAQRVHHTHQLAVRHGLHYPVVRIVQQPRE